MKKHILFFVLIIAAVMNHAQAQTAPVKVGTADVNYILSQLPAIKKVEAELKDMEGKLTTQIEAKNEELKKRYLAFINEGGSLADPVKESTQNELQQASENLEQLKRDAQTSLQNKHQQLMQPIYKSVGEAITAVGKENGFTVILSQQVGGLDVVLFADASIDVSDLVLKKMGVTPTPPAAKTAAGKSQPKQ
ncbi:OmpH family outer membrane protein [Fulvivirgaceae bacterium PWU4]|uniref:OmpH family outer membrane protein n=1 Tax=Chryseosolibacter histidini TaxID=2782349 RepID=A0AAP2GHL8_9BACT|nr:OmpH family outer membrane protein [Chryseosolibacter histidini]MBT1696171.1 OmpH family outer membrane protein [Chryseosolibacter histidini]